MQPVATTVRLKRWFRTRTALLIVFAISLFLFVFPIVMLIIGAFRNTDPTLPADWGLHGFVEVYSNPRTYETFFNSLILATVATSLSLLFALYLAFLSARSTAPLRKLVTPMAVIVLALPPMFFAVSWGMLGNKRVGGINQILSMLIGSPVELFNMNSWFGVIVVTVLHTTAVLYLLLIGPFMALDKTLEEAAQVAGAGGLRAFFGIDLPVLSPTIIGVGILAFVRGLEAFDVPIILGTPAGIRVVATEIYGQIQNFTPPNYGGASALAISLLGLVILLVFLQWRILGNRQFTTVTGKSFRNDRWELGGWKYVGTVVIALYGIFAVLLPGMQLIYGAFQPFFGAKFGNFTSKHIIDALTKPELVDSIILTLSLAFVCGAAAAIFSAIVSYLVARQKSMLSKMLDLAVWLPWAVPGVVLSLAFAWAYLSIPGLKSLYGTPLILGLALVVSAVPVTMRPVQGAIAQLGKELEDAARTNGATPTRMFFSVVMRIIAPSFFSAWFVGAILVAGNLAVPTLLAGHGSKPVPLLVFRMYNEGGVAESSALLLVHLFALYTSIAILWVIYRLSLKVAAKINTEKVH